MVRGIGIVVMAITILPLLKVGGMQLFKMEGPDSTEKILPRTIEVATIIISTYIILTFLCGFFYWFFGMTIFDSVRSCNDNNSYWRIFYSQRSDRFF